MNHRRHLFLLRWITTRMMRQYQRYLGRIVGLRFNSKEKKESQRREKVDSEIDEEDEETRSKKMSYYEKEGYVPRKIILEALVLRIDGRAGLYIHT